MKSVKIGLLGLGNIGTGTYKTLEMNRDQIEKETGLDLRITRILEKDTTRDRGIDVDPACFTQDADDIFNDPDIKIVIELLGGIEPATSFMLKAMESGKSVVTANKAAVAANFDQLMKTAGDNGVEIRFEASVGGGIPILNALTTVLRANKYDEILGILNGTTNYIMTQMTEYGLEYEDVLKTAQEKGFAEADPTADVEGIDVANKLSILMALTFGNYVPPMEIPREGITGITKEDIQRASDNGCKIKLIAQARKTDNGIDYSVRPMELPLDHPLASVSNEFNAIFVKGNAVGELMFYGKGAGPLPTGSAVMGDVLEIAKNL
ncbi:MAG: homoserine dehydrogenase [Anaerovoracaceae bacterium]|jgi:homoserine dehydrogenase